jgi:ribonuclease HI
MQCCSLRNRGRRDRADKARWLCDLCKEEEKRNATPAPATTIPISGRDGGNLNIRILQWNCDSLAPKVEELEKLLSEKRIDVAVLQETKLRAEDGDIVVADYNMVRRDRQRCFLKGHSRGGGLAFLVKKGVAYRTLWGKDVDGAEMLAIEIIGRDVTLKMANVYVPPTRSRGGGIQCTGWLDVLPLEKEWLVIGDVNAHHEWWDAVVPRDERGEQLAERLEDNQCMVLNEGEATRYHRGTGIRSTPDVCICHTEEADRWSWEVVGGLSSDHLPIIVSPGTPTSSNKDRKRLTWAWKRADWEAYGKQVTAESLRIMEVEEATPVSDLEKMIRSCILDAAKKWIGMKAMLTRNQGVITDEIRAEIAKRDEMKSAWGENVDSVKEADTRINALVKEERRAQWRQHVDRHASGGKMWTVLRQLRGKKPPDRSGEMLVHRGRGIAGGRAKANAFVEEYARVSRVRVPKELQSARNTKKLVARHFREADVPTEEDAEITLEEVQAALQCLDERKASGPDEIHPRLLRMLPLEGVKLVWRLFNRSWMETVVPQNWRQGKIVPLLKEGKPADQVASYRPICLTATLGKWMERVLANRLTYCMESRGLLSHMQAGFRGNRSVEDQLLRLSQSIEDGFQEKKKTVLAIFDYAKAYDRVWRPGLLWKMTQMGLGNRLIRWTQEWFASRRAWVELNGVTSDGADMVQGLPQGAVLSPLLFLIYINDLAEEVNPEEVEISLFADDVAVWSKDRSVERATTMVQHATEAIVRWSKRWLMTLSVEKCEVSLFSLDQALANHRPEIFIGETCLQFQPHPTFLGVTYDRRLSFGEHVGRCREKARRRVRLLKAVGGTDWGFDRDLLSKTYKAIVRSVLEYGGAAWMPWIGKTDWKRLEGVQAEAARTIVGATATSPTEAVLEEAGLRDLQDRAVIAATIAYERNLRADEADPRRELTLKEPGSRLKRSCWRTTAKARWRECFGEAEEELEPFPKPLAPWRRGCERIFDRGEKKEEMADINRAMALERLGQGSYDLTLYTDGSVAEGGVNGGGGVVVYREREGHVEKVKTMKLAAGKYASSYQAEMMAMVAALKWLVAEPGWKNARVVSDSKSGLDALASRGSWRKKDPLVQEVRGMWTRVESGRTLTFCWVPGHCGLVGNEQADVVAKEGSKMDQQGVSWLYSTAKARIAATRRGRVFHHERSRDTYGDGGVKQEREPMLERGEAVSWRRFRIGHSMELRSYTVRVTKEGESMCRRCGEEEETNLHVLLRCPFTEELRHRHHITTAADFTKQPRAVYKLWCWFRGGGGRPPDETPPAAS